MHPDESNNSFFKKFSFKTLFKKSSKESSLRDTIEELIEEDEHSKTQSIEKNEREILGNVLNLRDINVEDIMIPRIEIEAIPVNTRIEELMSKFVETQKSSIIVYKESMDSVIGVVYLKDVANWFHMNKPFNVSVFVKDVLFVPPSMKSLDLLFKMRETGIKLAIVVDEYGGIDGLLSFRDVIEEVIGDIQEISEIKEQKKKVLKKSDGAVIADAKSTFSEIQKYGGIKIIPKDKSVDTIGGMISSIAGKVPVRGELIIWPKQDLEFEILDADPRKVKSVKIRKTR
ncbi:MAG: CBS domain-containing protein [Holosporales bacterium]|jgi:CBS domain containing-hemolysin-like protein|nr:CBS domain-containing protein [Holosporales bacterium]